ncbi:TetR/AcrR family transcriptional regulator [Isoptericola sediminis]|uniref:TetR/AcrR family transcriptional regulator n=1 Tax=Isoptericola sediminis TaxID=2733572 RepID=A0A849JRL8_9MICO|nr:TetR/AcrR family transcriptional regulator [Isoptericola sediminis]NNU26086.1 TetR/AcrR family transcriptional regulator [Isoptericola sediminis]
MTSRTRQDPADRRRQLLDVACETAEAGGLETLTPAAVAAQAGASKGLVFHYFGTTAQLRRAVALEAIERLAADLAPDDGPLVERPARALSAFLGSVTARRRVWEDIWRGVLAGDPVTEDALRAIRADLVGRLTTLADIGVTPDARLDLLARGWVALAETMTAAWLGEGSTSREDLSDLLLSSLSVLVPELPEPARSAVAEVSGAP